MRPPFLVAVILSAGCATSLSGFQPAHVAPKGHFTAEVGVDGSLPTGTIPTLIDAAKGLVTTARERQLRPEERERLLATGVNLALDPPAAVTHAAVAYVPVSGWELALRYASGGWRLGARHQLLAQERHGLDLSAGVGLGRFSYSFPIGDLIGILELDDFVRWSVDLPVLLGKRGSFYRVWGGPRVLLARYSAALRLELPAVQGAAAETILASVEGDAGFYGLQGGVALGYRHVFLAVELTVVRLFSTAQLTTPAGRREVDLGGWILYPGVALLLEL
jgi:hypothetical protein